MFYLFIFYFYYYFFFSLVCFARLLIGVNCVVFSRVVKSIVRQFALSFIRTHTICRGRGRAPREHRRGKGGRSKEKSMEEVCDEDITSTSSTSGDTSMAEAGDDDVAAAATASAVSSPEKLLRDAASRGDVDRVRARLIIPAGHGDVAAALDAADEDGKTALCAAASGGHEEVVRMLLSAGATDVNRALEGAARGGHEETVRLLIDAGANVNRSEEPCGRIAGCSTSSRRSGSGSGTGGGTSSPSPSPSPLWVAARDGHDEVARVLIASGAHVNRASKGGRTPLYAVVESAQARRSIIYTAFILLAIYIHTTF